MGRRIWDSSQMLLRRSTAVGMCWRKWGLPRLRLRFP